MSEREQADAEEVAQMHLFDEEYILSAATAMAALRNFVAFADRHKKAHMPEVLIADGFADLVEGYADCVSYANEREAYEAHATATIEAYIEAAPEAVKMFMVPADRETAN